MTEPPIETLFLRYAQNGDLKALAEVFDRAAPELLPIAANLCRTQDDLEDALQSTFLSAIESTARFDAGRSLMPWLTGILIHKCRHQRRKGVRERAVQSADEIEPLDGADPSSHAERREFQSTLAQTIRSLPELYADILRRHLEEGLKAIEIAQELGRAPGTVRMQILRGMEMLRAALPASVATGALATVLSGRGIAAVRTAVLEKAAASCAKTGASGGAIAGALGKKLLVAAAILTTATFLLVTRPWIAVPRTTGNTAPSSGDEEALSSSMAAFDSEGRASRVDVDSPKTLGALLTLVDADGNPASEAQVSFMSSEEWHRLESTALHFDAKRPENLFAQGGLHVRADKMGRAWMPALSDKVYVLAQRNGSKVMQLLHPRPAATLRLERARSIDVFVADSEGRPCPDLPLRIATVDGRKRIYDHRGIGGRTNAEGWARIEDVHKLERPDQGRHLVVSVGLPFVESAEVVLDLDDFSGDPLHLQVPKVGSVRVRILDETGNLQPGHVALFHRPESEDRREEARLRSRQRSFRRVLARSGEVVFPFVGVGAHVIAEVQATGPYDMVSVESDEAVREGDELTLIARLGAKQPELRGRLFGSSGLPVANSSVHYEMGSRSHSVVTDDDGGFRIVCDTASSRKATEVTLSLQDDSNALIATANFPVPAVLASGPNHVGDVRLHAVERLLLASGVVVDGAGNPIPFASVAINGQGGWSNRHRTNYCKTTSKIDGTFEVYAGSLPSSIVAHASYREKRGELTAEAGATDLRIVVVETPEWSIYGNVLLPEGIPTHGIVVLSKRTHQPVNDSGSVRNWKLDRDGAFRTSGAKRAFEPLDLGVYLAGDDEPLITIENVTPWRENDEPDVRLQSIDLRGRVHLQSFKVTNPEGNPIEFAYAFPRVFGRSSVAGHLVRDGSCEFLTREPVIGVDLRAKGYRSRQFERVTLGEILVLEPGTPIEIHCALSEDYGDDVTVTYSLHRVNPKRSSQSYRSGDRSRGPIKIFEGSRRVSYELDDSWTPKTLAFDENGVARMTLIRPGPFQVKGILEVSKTLQDGSRLTTGHQFNCGDAFTLEDLGPSLVHRVAMTQQELDNEVSGNLERLRAAIDSHRIRRTR